MNRSATGFVYGERLVGEFLHYFEMLAASIAQIFVERHYLYLNSFMTTILVWRLLNAAFSQ